MLSWLEVSFPSFIYMSDRAEDRQGSPPEYVAPHGGPRGDKCPLARTSWTGGTFTERRCSLCSFHQANRLKRSIVSLLASLHNKYGSQTAMACKHTHRGATVWCGWCPDCGYVDITVRLPRAALTRPIIRACSVLRECWGAKKRCEKLKAASLHAKQSVFLTHLFPGLAAVSSTQYTETTEDCNTTLFNHYYVIIEQ